MTVSLEGYHMKFCWSTITVKSMDDSVNFYQDVIGLPLMNRYEAGPGMEIAFLGDGETQIELICRGSQLPINMGQDISLGFLVDNLDETMAFVREKGIEIHSGPHQPNSFIRFFYILDPNGLKIQFVETK